MEFQSPYLYDPRQTIMNSSVYDHVLAFDQKKCPDLPSTSKKLIKGKLPWNFSKGEQVSLETCSPPLLYSTATYLLYENRYLGQLELRRYLYQSSFKKAGCGVTTECTRLSGGHRDFPIAQN